MPDGSPQPTLTLYPHIAEIGQAAWDACAGDENPFVSYGFLSALEDSGSVGSNTGWHPRHAVLRDAAGDIIALAPAYAKTHSYGEYVFDHGWANALERAGGRYYPKLQVAVPFSPVPGPRILARPGATATAAMADALMQAARELRCSSVHAPSARRRSGMNSGSPAGCSASARSSTGTMTAMRVSMISSPHFPRASARRSGANAARPRRASPSAP
jgi:predicted N-acyltransferase